MTSGVERSANLTVTGAIPSVLLTLKSAVIGVVGVVMAILSIPISLAPLSAVALNLITQVEDTTVPKLTVTFVQEL